jgi:hypothetical protein
MTPDEQMWDVLIKPSDAAFVRLGRALVALKGRWIDSAKIADALCVRVVLPAEAREAFRATVKPLRMDHPPEASV